MAPAARSRTPPLACSTFARRERAACTTWMARSAPRRSPLLRRRRVAICELPGLELDLPRVEKPPRGACRRCEARRPRCDTRRLGERTSCSPEREVPRMQARRCTSRAFCDCRGSRGLRATSVTTTKSPSQARDARTKSWCREARARQRTTVVPATPDRRQRRGFSSGRCGGEFRPDAPPAVLSIALARRFGGSKMCAAPSVRVAREESLRVWIHDALRGLRCGCAPGALSSSASRSVRSRTPAA